MPRTFQSSEMEGFYGTLYELVCPMMASDSCVKCITKDGSTTFTSDPEHLLRNVDIEHPAGELVLRTLQSHKHTFGTGTKTLLFMLASLAKAVVQLSKLGIHSDDSLDVIREVFTDLAKEVQEISVESNECFHSSKQECLRREITNYDSKNCDASCKPQSDRKLTACDKTDALNTPETVLQQYLEKGELLNILHSGGVGKEHCQLPEENIFTLHSNLTSSSADNLPELCDKAATACTSKKYNRNIAKQELNSLTCNGSSGVAFSCSDQEITITDVAETCDPEVKWKSNGEIQDTLCASVETVLLKMSNLQHLSGDNDDIDWFFDNSSSQDCTAANTSPTGHHVSLEMTNSSDKCLNCFMYPEDQVCKTNSLDSPEHEIQWNCSNINSPIHDLQDLHSSELRNMVWINHENKLITDGGMHLLKDDEQNCSDSRNCFDEYSKRPPVEVDNSISSEKLDNKAIVSTMQSYLKLEPNCFGSELFSNSRNKTFKKDSKFILADGQITENHDDDDDDEEFAACFNDFDGQNSAVMCEYSTVKQLNYSEITSSCQMADRHLTEKCNSDDDEFDACFSAVDNQHSSVTCENDLIQCLKHSEYPFPCQTLEKINIKPKQLFPNEFRALCDVQFTKSANDSKDTIRTSDMESSNIVTHKSEIEKLNALLESSRGKKSSAGFPKLSRHLHPIQDMNLQHREPKCYVSTTNIDISNRSALHISESTLSKGYLQDIVEGGDNSSSGISAYDMKNPLQAHEYYDTCSFENHSYRSSSQEHSEENNISSQRKTTLCTRACDNHSEEYNLIHKGNISLCTSEVHDDNKHRPNICYKDSQMLLDQLLQEKKAIFRSTVADKIMLSSRHFRKVSGNDMSSSSLLHKDSGLEESTTDEGTDYCFYSKHMVTQNLSKGYVANEGKTEFDSVKVPTSHVLQNETVTVSDALDAGLGACTHFQNQHVETHTHTCSEASGIHCLHDSACCHPAVMWCRLSAVPKEHYRADQPQAAVDCLHDCKSDVGDAAKYIFQNQIKDYKDTRFNFHLVNCLILSSLVSLPESFTSSWRSSTSPISVTPGLVIPCSSQILEKLQLNQQSLVTLLIGGDLTANFHHKGYVPTLSRRHLIARSNDGTDKADERMWCTNMLCILKKLNVKLLLVKGQASSVLIDMCEGEDVLLLTNISYHTLSVLSYLHRVDIVTYLSLANEENICTISLQPLSTTWMDHLQDTGSHFVVITRTPDVQTAIIHCSNSMSAHLIEERLWKCLHSIANLQTDTKMLPGQGKTEIWCAKRIVYKSECMFDNQPMVQSVILEAVADIFQDYYRTVIHNTKFSTEEHIQKGNDPEINSLLTTQCRNAVGYPEQNCCSKIYHLPCEITACVDSQTSNDSFKNVTGKQMKQSVSKELDMFKAPDLSFKLNASSTGTVTDNSENMNSSYPSSENKMYDNFKSKVSAWKTAVECVSVMQSLGCLVISGIDTMDINEGMSLL